MKILKGILYGILALLTLLSLFIVICGFNPEVADAVSEALYAWTGDDRGQEQGGVGGLGGAESLGSGSGETGSEAAGRGLSGSNDSPLVNAPATDYVPPDRSAIRTPEQVTGRSGYEPVKEDTREVDEEEAGQIQEQLSLGETGDGLTFDLEFYPYYGMLDEGQQKLYRQIYANGMAGTDRFAPIVPVTMAQFRNAFMAVFCDHPELFWLECAYGGLVAQDGNLVEVLLTFNTIADNLEGAKATFADAAEEILAGGRNQGSVYDKEVYVHNALLDRIEYDLQAPLNQNAYSAVVNGRTVCAGYARAFQYLMQQLGVPCYLCTGYAGESHAWNIIKLDGEFYNVDTTWDDTNPNTFDYFNRTDQDFAGDHVREDLSVYLPACNGTKYRGQGAVQDQAAAREQADAQNQTDIQNQTDTQNQADAPNQADAQNQADTQNQTGQVPYPEEGTDQDGTANQGGEAASSDIWIPSPEVLTNMADYYEDCYKQIMRGGGSSTQFQNVIDKSLWEACARAYRNNEVEAGYMSRVAEELSLAEWEVLVRGEEQGDGTMRLTHDVILNY